MPQTQLPANFAGVLSMSAGQQMNLGVPTPSFDGRSAFTLSGWFQVPSTEDTVVVLAQGNLFSFSFSGRRPTVTLGSAATLRMDQPLPAGQFHQLAAVYAPQQNNTSGTLSFFVDGAYVGDAAVSIGAPVTGMAPSLIVGNTQHPVAVRRIWLAPTAVPTSPDNLVVETRFGTLGAAPYSTQSSWDWGQVPAAITGAFAPIAIGGAAPSITTPGLWAGAQGMATAALPSGTAVPELTIQGWFYFPASVSPAQAGQDQVLIQLGAMPARLGLIVNPSSSGTWSITAWLGRSGFGKQGLTLSGWHNIAVTWAGGSTGILYLDGNLLVQGGAPNQLSSVDLSTAYIGNTPPGGQPANQAFIGSIQNVVLWNVALPAEDIQAQMLPWFPMTDVDPVAVYDFTQSPPFDIANGEALTLRNGAIVQNMLWSASAAEASTQLLTLEAKPKRTQSLKGLRPQSPPKVDPSVWTPEKEQQLLSQLRGYLAQGAGDARLQAEGPALEAKLKERFARGRAGNPDLTGIVHTELQGEEWITFLYGENGPQAILRRSTTNFKADSCMNWVIDFVATALFGLLDIMGIPLSAHAGTKALQKLLGKTKIWTEVTEVIAEAIEDLTTDTIVKLLKAIKDGGGMSSFVKAVLDDVSWWDFLWMVAQVTIELVGLLVPGLEEALVLAKCVVLVAQLIQLMTDRPAHCPV